MTEASEEERCPVTVLTGALGAGKTTLLKYILQKQHGFRIAVIQNEFSEEMGIESPLIKDAQGDTVKDVYELPNGCLCCSAKDGLISMLDRLLEERRRFDYILVEATGLADPENICEIFWVDDGLGSRVYLDGVVALVDAHHAPSVAFSTKSDAAGVEKPARAEGSGELDALGLEAEVTKQIACADVLIINKADLVSTAWKSHLASSLAALNPAASILESEYAAVPLGDILGIHAFDGRRLASSLANLVLPGSEDASTCSICGDPAALGFGTGFGTCGHVGCSDLVEGHRGVQSVLVRGDAEAVGSEGCSAALYNPAKVRSWMADVLWEHSAGGVYRCKGLFQGPPEDDPMEDCEACPPVAKEPVAYAVQGVGQLFEVDEAPRISVKQSKLLFIGRDLKPDVLEAGLRSCLFTKST